MEISWINTAVLAIILTSISGPELDSLGTAFSIDALVSASGIGSCGCGADECISSDAMLY